MKFLVADKLREVGSLVSTHTEAIFADELGRRDYVTGELWMNEPPFRFALNRAASDDNAWHCKHYAGRGEKSFYKSGAALAEDMGMPVSKMWESIEAQIQASLKTAQDLSVDLSDCTNDVQINSLQYCSDQNEIHATASKSFICVDVPLVRSSCSSVGATTYTGSGDHPSAVPFCYTGSKLGERVNLKVNSSSEVSRETRTCPLTTGRL